MTVAFHLDRCRKIWHSPRTLDQVLDRFDLTELMNTPVSRLSDGNRQLLNVAMAYMSYCEVVLLDEPMNALDVGHVAIVSNALRDEAGRGAHVIISSHLIGNLESLCDAAVLLTGDDSRVVTREMGVIRSGSVMCTRSFSRRTTVKLGKEDNHETQCNEELCEGNVRMFYAYSVDGHNSRLCDGTTRCRFCCTLSSCDGGCLGHLQIVLHCKPPE